ncbi:radical SAM protein [Streptomyces rubradiris]|uniref:radical SAM protein n=1 Tax=Streptomyces rubradiris TaxID=285531 RepID=UPI0036E84FE8
MTTGLQAPPEQAARLRFVSLELTQRCQFTCPQHCYAESGPTQGHGSMTDDDWRRVIDEAVALGTDTVQFIGGEPTLHPSFTGLVHYALAHGLRVRVYSGYGTALLCRRIGAGQVTSVDVDPYLVQAAADRLGSIGLTPHLAVADLTQPLPDQYDRIVATVSVPRIPAGWLTALRPGGRLVTTVSDTGLLIVADKTDDGGATGHVAWDRASFMSARTGDDYPPSTLDAAFDTAATADGEVTVSPLPVLDVAQA